MPIGTQADWILHDEVIWTLMSEIMEQESNAFNGASNGAILLTPQILRGEFETREFFPTLPMIAHRDPTSTGAATPISLGMGQLISPKVNKRIGPVEDTRNRWRKRAEDPDAMNEWLAVQLAAELPITYLNSAISSLVGLLTAAGATTGDGSAQITSLLLEDLKQVLGDKKQRIRMLVMTSLVHTALVKDQQTKQIYTTDGASIYQGIPSTGGIPTLVTDSPALVDTTPTPDHSRVLALTEGAAEVVESEERELVFQTNTGLDNLTQVLQGELAYNARVKGGQWDKTTANPQDSDLIASANWTYAFTDVKSGPGSMLIVEIPGGTG